jgi:uroporphyrinogen-III synthase
VKNSALAGRGIVVTRPSELAGALAAAIEKAGGNAILFATIAIEDAPPPDALRNLDAYDLAVFVSPTAVQKVMARVPTWPKRLQAAAIGGGSRRELERCGVSAVLAPEEGADSEALLALPELQRMQGKRVVVFRGGAGRPLLGNALMERGAKVEYAECYRRARPDSDPAPLLALWQRDAVHAVTVSSSEGLDNFITLVGSAGAAHLAATPLFVPHVRVAAHARELGAREVFVAGAADDAVVERLVAYFHERD